MPPKMGFETISCGNKDTCTRVVAEFVVRVDDPETGRIDVRVEEGVGHPGEDGKVVLDDVVHLHSVLEEEREPLDVVCDVVLHSGV